MVQVRFKVSLSLAMTAILFSIAEFEIRNFDRGHLRNFDNGHNVNLDSGSGRDYDWMFISIIWSGSHFAERNITSCAI